MFSCSGTNSTGPGLAGKRASGQTHWPKLQAAILALIKPALSFSFHPSLTSFMAALTFAAGSMSVTSTLMIWGGTGLGFSVQFTAFVLEHAPTGAQSREHSTAQQAALWPLPSEGPAPHPPGSLVGAGAKLLGHSQPT